MINSVDIVENNRIVTEWDEEKLSSIILQVDIPLVHNTPFLKTMIGWYENTNLIMNAIR